MNAPPRPSDAKPSGRLTSAPYGVDHSPLLEAAASQSSLLISRGSAAIAFAFLAFFWPGLTLPGLTILWGLYSLADGVLALITAIRGRPGTPRGWLSLIGMAGIACAGALLFAPEEIAEHFLAIVSTWALLTGMMQVWVALKLRKAVHGSWILVFDGIGTILFGLAFASWPRPEVAALVWLTGWSAAMLGGLFLCVSYWLRWASHRADVRPGGFMHHP